MKLTEEQINKMFEAWYSKEVSEYINNITGEKQ